MKNIKFTFAKRLKLARQKEKLSMEELSNRTGGAVSKQTLSKYEAGKTMAGSVILGKLANALNVPIDYFFRPFSFDITALDISFRKKTSVRIKDEASLKSEIQDKVERYLEIERILSIESRLDTIKQYPTITTASQMKEIATDIRKKWELGNAPIENAKRLILSHGVKVFEVKGPDGFDGVSGAANKNTCIIVLNSQTNHIERKRMTIFHEYAHLLANNYFCADLSQHEKEKLCNVFASEILLPSQILIDTFATKTKITFQELVSVQRIYGISIDAIMYSLKSSSVISDKRYRSYCILKNKNNNFKNAVEKTRFKEKEDSCCSDSEQYTNMVYSALAQKLISPIKASELLNLPVNDIQSQSIAF